MLYYNYYYLFLYLFLQNLFHPSPQTLSSYGVQQLKCADALLLPALTLLFKMSSNIPENILKEYDS